MPRKSTKSINKTLAVVNQILFDIYGDLTCPLNHLNPYQLMTAVILSAQCTDKRVNAITPVLFSKYPNLTSMAEAEVSEVAKIIKPAGCFRIKSQNIVNCCRKIISDFDGKVPQTMKELTSLPGIGRKSANVLLGNMFGIPGFPVDTHVNRVLNRIGIVSTKDPVKIEVVVNKALESKSWTNFSHLLITHGRNRCKARKPDCKNCEIRQYCQYQGKIF